MRKFLTGAILFAATTVVAQSAHAAVLSAGLSTVDNGDGTITVLIYAKTDTGLAAPQNPSGAAVAANSGTGFWDGIAGFGFDVIGTSGAYSYSGNSVNDINAGDVSTTTTIHSTSVLSTIDPAPALANTKPAYAGNTTMAALNGSFSPKPSPVTTATNNAKAYEQLSTLGTPAYGTNAKGTSFPAQSGGGFDTVPTSGQFAGYSLIDEEIWTRNTNAADTLRLFIIGGAQYNHASSATNFQVNYPNGNFEGTPVQFIVEPTGPSLTLGTVVDPSTTIPGSVDSYLATALGANGSFTLGGTPDAAGHTLVALDLSGQSDYSNFFGTSLPSGASQVSDASATATLAAFNATVGGSYDVLIDLGAGVPNGSLSVTGLPAGVTLNAIAAVPEPTTLSLAGIAGMALLGRRRRQA